MADKIIAQYDGLLDEDNDPTLDPPKLQEYMTMDIMRFEWKEYCAIEQSIVESFLDKDAVCNTGCDEGVFAFYSYWIGEKDTVLNKNFWCRVIYENNAPLGVIAVGKYDEDYVISELILAPNERGRGKGTEILRELLKFSNEILGQAINKARAVIFPDNIASKKAFEKAGFMLSRVHEDGDALIYEFSRK